MHLILEWPLTDDIDELKIKCIVPDFFVRFHQETLALIITQ